MKYHNVRRMKGGKSASRNKSNLNRQPTAAESSFAKALQTAGIRYRQNFIVRTPESFGGYYLVDFYLPKYKLFVELDGGVHKSESRKWKDTLRTEAIIRKYPDHNLIRFWNGQVEKDASLIISQITAT